MIDIPTGTVTFLFTDIEGSTKLSQEFPDTLPIALEKHHSILNVAIESNNGFVFEIIGDAFCCAFLNASDAVKAAYDAQLKLSKVKWDDAVIKVRIGIHSGNVEWNGKRYMGYITLARSARVMSAAYGEQILISNDAYERVKDKSTVTNQEIGNESLKNEISFRDLGERRLKDVIQPIRLFQIISPSLREDFPPLKTLDARPNNLPVQLTSFIGREEEMKHVKNLLKQTHLLTLTGSGGSGKTRLALQVAADVIDDFANGVWFVELAQLSDPNIILQEIGSALGLKGEGMSNLIDTIIEFLREKELLLILDNCEHLISECARVADALLRSCRKLKILATSREALRVEGETVYRIPSLSVPDIKVNHTLNSLFLYDSVKLFIERASTVNLDFSFSKINAQAVTQICYNLEGIPFAIELAAARVVSLPVEKIAERLNDRFHFLTGGKRTALPRQQTLDNMIDWSYGLLTESEKSILRRMSVFPGGLTLETVEDACSGGNIKTYEVLDLIYSLVIKSLVVSEESTKTYRLPETVRLYGIKKLIEFDKQVFPGKTKLFHNDNFVDRIKPGKKTLNYLKNNKYLLIISAFLFLTIVISLYKIDSGKDNYIAIGNDAHKKFTYKEALYYYTLVLNNYENSETYISRAKVFNDMYYFEDAVKDLDKSIKLEDKDAESYYLRAFAKNYLGDLRGSLEDFNKSIELNPDYPDAYIGRANLYGNNILSNYEDETISVYDKSVSDFNKVLENDPNNIEAILYLGVVYGKKYEYEKEREQYKKATTIEPKNYVDLLNRSLAFSKLFMHKESLSDLSKALEQNPNFIKGYFSRIEVLKDMYKYDEAIKDCEKLLSLLKVGTLYFYFANSNTGRIYDFKRDYLKAKHYYTELRDFKPKFTKEYLLKAENFSSLKEWDSCILECKIVVDKDPRNAVAIAELLSSELATQNDERSKVSNILNETFKENKENDKFWSVKSKFDLDRNQALQDISTAIEINPYNAEHYKIKSDKYYQLEKYNLALMEIAKAIDKNPNNFTYYNSSFKYNYSLNNYNRCLEVLKKGIELNPYSDKIYYSISLTYSALNESENNNNVDYFKLSLKNVNQAIDINPYNPAFFRQRGNVYYRSKNYSAAVVDWEYMLSLDESYKEYNGNDLDDAKKKLASQKHNPIPLQEILWGNYD